MLHFINVRVLRRRPHRRFDIPQQRQQQQKRQLILFLSGRRPHVVVRPDGFEFAALAILLSEVFMLMKTRIGAGNPPSTGIHPGSGRESEHFEATFYPLNT